MKLEVLFYSFFNLQTLILLYISIQKKARIYNPSYKNLVPQLPDALMINDDGSTYCFSCGTHHSCNDVSAAPEKQKEMPKEFFKGVSKDIEGRCINKSTCSRYKYNIGKDKDREIQIATYRDLDSNPIFQKIRYSDEKEFRIVGKFKPLLYGMHLFRGNDKKIIITEAAE